MIENINKISIIGGPGTGKSTLSKNIGKQLGLPVYHIDAIHHLDNWEERDKKDRDRIILEKVSQPKWIIDGTYKSTLEKRVQESDLIIFLNYSKTARLKGIFSRYFEWKGHIREEIPGCKEKMTWKFIKFTFNWDKDKGKNVKQILEKNNDKNILVFKNRDNLNKWYQEKFNKKIELYSRKRN